MKTIHILVAVPFLLAVIFLGYFTGQDEFQKIVLGYSIAFGIFLYFLKLDWQKLPILKFAVILGILARFALLFSFPGLSDDIYRFIWDGSLIQQGINPYAYLPGDEFLIHHTEYDYNAALYARLNSPNYYSVYPPLSQIIFYISAVISKGDWLSSSIVIRCFILVFELGTIFFLPQVLRQFEIKKEKALYYILNPLIIVELTGNLHLEAGMIFFLVLFLYYLKKNQYAKSGFFAAGSILFKLLPLIFLPALIRKFSIRKIILHYSIIGITILGAFIPFYSNSIIWNLGNSIDLYFQKFEFNASLYYLLRFMGFQIKGYNLISIIGPFLGFVSLFAILYISLSKRFQRLSLPEIWFWAILIFLICSTTVHPWYLSGLILLNCFYGFKFVHLWSFLICLTYINYAHSPYFENLWVMVIEYGLVFGIMFFEISRGKWRFRSQE